MIIRGMNKIGKREGGKEKGVSVLMKEEGDLVLPHAYHTPRTSAFHIIPHTHSENPFRKPITLNL